MRRPLVLSILLVLVGMAFAQPVSPHTVFGTVQRFDGTYPRAHCIHFQFRFGVRVYTEISPEFSYDSVNGRFFLRITDDLFRVGDTILISAIDSCLFEEASFVRAFQPGPQTDVGTFVLNPIAGLRPYLLAGFITPTTGYVTNNYLFGVTYYSNPWNRPPGVVRVWIDGARFWDMAWSGSGTPRWDLGEPFLITIDGHDIGKGNHNFRFYAEDNIGLPAWTSNLPFTILNTAPTAPFVHIEPANPFDDENLTAIIDVPAFDEDGDVLSYLYEWYRDGELVYWGYGFNVLPASETYPGEDWMVKVYAHDGEVLGPAGWNDATITAPLLSGGSVAPLHGDRETIFTYTVTYSNVREVAPSFVNVIIDGGAPIPMSRARVWAEGVVFTYSTTLDLGAHTYRFAAMDELGHIAFGDVGVHVGPYVGNRPPEIEGAEIIVDPLPASRWSELIAIGIGWFDHDGDPEGYRYNWYVNGELISFSGQILTSDYFVRGDVIFCVVIPFDGFIEGEGVATGPVVIGNALPTAPVVAYSPVPVYDNDIISLTIIEHAIDPDDERLDYHYEWSIGGRIVGGDLPTLAPTFTAPGDLVNVRIWARDAFGESDVFSLNIPIRWPILSDGAVFPVSGSPVETFRYEVKYTSERNIAPDEVFAVIDGVPTRMSPVNPADIDYTDGFGFYLETRLPFGTHTYAFIGHDIFGNSALGEETPRPGPVQENNPPVVTYTEISPYPTATEADLITVYAEGFDADDDPITFVYRWFNTRGLIEGATMNPLPGVFFAKGDIVWAEVRANDGWENGPPVLTDRVTIVNTLPTINSAEIIAEPSGWFNELGVLIANVDANDLDGDAIIYEYHWFVNSVEVSTADRIDGSLFDRGDEVYFVVSVYDDEGLGDTRTSEVVTIGNAPPVFAYIAIDPRTPTTVDGLEVVASVFDPDGDPVDITYDWFLDDVDIDYHLANVPSFMTEKHQTWRVLATASDPFGGISRGTSTVTILNTAPIVSAVVETIVIWGVPYRTNIRAFDPDADRLRWRLVRGPDFVRLDSLTGIFSWDTFNPSETLGIYPISIIVSDGEVSVPVVFNLSLYPFGHRLLAPTNLDALSGYMLSIPMMWTPPAIFRTGMLLPVTFVNYEIERSTDHTDWYPIGTATGAGYVDLSVTPVVTYFYRVRAVYNEGNSAWSNVDFAVAGTINSDMLYSIFTYQPLPVIDGNIGVGEWSDATILEIGSHKFYVKNNERKLFIAFVDGADLSLDYDDAFYVQIEDNYNRRWPLVGGSSEGEYRVRALGGRLSEATFQGIWGVYPSGIGRDARGLSGEVTGAVGGGSGAPVVYEISIEINPDESIPAAINNILGNVIGFRFASYNAGTLSWTYTWLSGSTSTDPESFGNLMLGTGFGGPRFAIWPRFFDITVLQGQMDSRPLWISNQGNGTLNYRLFERYLPVRARTTLDLMRPVLLFTDGQTIGQTALNYLGYGYDVVTNNADFISRLTIRDYRAVVVTHLGPLSNAVLAKLEEFVAGGGKAIVSCPDLDRFVGHTIWNAWGMNIYSDLGTTPSAITWDVPAHPIFNTPLEVPPSVEFMDMVLVDYGDALSSRGAIILASFDERPYPVNGAIALSRDEKAIVNSFVLSDTRDSDRDGMADGLELLINEIYYVASLDDIPWLSVSPMVGRLASHVTDEATVTFDARTLSEGDYLGYIIATSDDPEMSTVTIPCQLHVRAPVFNLVRIAFEPRFRNVMPGERFSLPIVATGLRRSNVTDISMTIRVNPAVLSPDNVYSDHEITITSYGLDHISFRLHSPEPIGDGSLCRISFVVKELALVGSFSNLNIGDVNYNMGSFVGSTEIVNGRVLVEAGEMDWRILLRFTTSGFLSDNIYIGVNPEGTNMFDPGLDMVDDPPAHWFNPYSDISAYDPVYTRLDGDIRNSFDFVITWTIPTGDSAGKVEWSFRDVDTLLAMGSLFLNGNINMKTTSVYFFEPGETLIIVYRRTGESPFAINLYPGWNMVSLPIIPSEVEPTPRGVFPGSMFTYYFDAGRNMWVPATNIEPGIGYVVLVTTPQHYTIWGQPVESYVNSLTRGWNLIGSIYRDADFHSPTTVPPGAILGAPEHAYYWDVISRTYIMGDVLEPGKAYFVACNMNAVLYVPGVAGGGKSAAPTINYRISMDVDVNGVSTRLSFGSSIVDWIAPIPPSVDGSLEPAYLAVDIWKTKEAYFSTSPMCDLVVREPATITVSGVPEGLQATIEINGANVPLDGTIELQTAGVYRIKVGDLPRKFALHGNMPNPFNATTAIKFDLPKRCKVELDIYDLLGNRITKLSDRELPAGSHMLVWDGRDCSGRPVPSGVYFYRIIAGGDKATSRMLLIK